MMKGTGKIKNKIKRIIEMSNSKIKVEVKVKVK
jgi:hypothetical protein